MKTKKEILLNADVRLPYETPCVNTQNVELEYSVAAGSVQGTMMADGNPKSRCRMELNRGVIIGGVNNLFMKKLTINLRLASFVLLTVWLSSCSKDSGQAMIETGTTVRLNIGQSYIKADPIKTDPIKTASVGRSYAAATQTVEIPFDNQYILIATLKEEVAPSYSGIRAANRATAASTNAEQHALKEGTTYYVAIFDMAGVYKETKTFTQDAMHRTLRLKRVNIHLLFMLRVPIRHCQGLKLEQL
ncbi:hypothetical protein [Sphingobacterium thalpophilum]|uniref:Uncharacterized protein n=1 Tax=Sphingobacterium thalpophilum TaxID=259 RepID=A0A4U9UW73_9SPHI|nr:hypothetical protein [Sphingobacterium thalpophilum]VTR34131.1 Uncharacterised protein [Sphingobacterium thalpophilum]